MELINEFEEARGSLIWLVDNFPKEKRELILFHEWSLKDILSHLSGWAKYQTDTLKKSKKGVKTKMKDGLKDSINNDFVIDRAKRSWDKVYLEFLKLTEELIEEYRSLPDELWDNEVYQEKKTTINDFIKIEIDHYEKTHGPKIRELLKGFENFEL